MDGARSVIRAIFALDGTNDDLTAEYNAFREEQMNPDERAYYETRPETQGEPTGADMSAVRERDDEERFGIVPSWKPPVLAVPVVRWGPLTEQGQTATVAGRTLRVERKWGMMVATLNGHEVGRRDSIGPARIDCEEALRAELAAEIGG